MNIPAFSVNNRVAVNLLMWAIIFSGIYYWVTLVREFFPAISTEQISIMVPYPGATPEDVERAITLRIERGIRDIDGVDEIESTVLEGMSLTTVKLDEDADRDRVLNSIRSEIDQVKPEFPSNAEDPEILEVRPNMPVISVVLSGDVPEEKLRALGREVRDELLDLGGITEVNLIGVRKREIWAEVRPEKLEEHGLTFDQVGRAVSQSNLDIPGGQIKGRTGNVRIRTMGESQKAAEIEKLVIKTGDDGSAIRLSDIATVRDTFEDRVMRGRFAGKPSVSLIIFKTPEQDALKISAQVKQFVNDHPSRMGGAVQVNVTSDLARFIDQRLDLMVRNARNGLILVVLTLALFLSLRTSFWVALGLPVSLLGAFAVMAWLGASINLLSLFSLIIVLGLIVDDAVVIGEAVHTKIQQGVPPLRAAVEGANEMALPVMAAVLTTVIAFLPLMFMGGMWGDFLGIIPVVVISALTVSVVEAFIILPSHLVHVRKRREKPGPPGPAGWMARVGAVRDRVLGTQLQASFERVLRFFLRWRYPAVAASFAAFIAIMGLIAGGVVPFVLLQEVDAEQVTVNLEMAAGTPEARTLDVIQQIERLAFEYPEVASVFG
ncbi:MAG: efflux RND transporter permease subunit, partial [Planctomycetota bacterium]